MLRALLIVLLLAIVAGTAFYAGRVTAPESHSAISTPAEPANMPAPVESATGTRARTLEPPSSPPAISAPMPQADPSKVLASEDSNGVLGHSIGLPIAGLRRGDIQDTFDQ